MLEFNQQILEDHGFRMGLAIGYIFTDMFNHHDKIWEYS